MTNETQQNIGPWERAVAEEHNLHMSWLVPSYHGSTCPCCKKLRRYDHYITDVGVCVFCSAACTGKRGCQSKTFSAKRAQPAAGNSASPTEGAMSELDRCPEMEKIPRVLGLDKPIPRSLIEHAKKCKQCLFWLSWSLAIKRAVLATNRLKSSGCPRREEFNCALMIAARSIRTTKGLIKKRSMRKLQHVSLEELSEMNNFREHVDECGLCGVYWDNLNDAAIAAQEEYASLIKTGGELRPIVTATASEQEIPPIYFVDNPSQRPN